jgi:hypothetical protein
MRLAALLFELYGFRDSSGSLAMLAMHTSPVPLPHIAQQKVPLCALSRRSIAVDPH